MSFDANDHRRESLAGGARRKAETFDWQHVAARMRAIYETL